VLDSSGKKVEVQFDKHGEPFYTDSDGKVVKLPNVKGKKPSGDEKQVLTDANGKKFVMVDGKK
jgi:hypothetical protein